VQFFVRVEWGGDQPDNSDSFTSFTFLPNTLTHASDDGISSPLAFNSPSATQYVPGAIADFNLVWLDHSGFNAAAVIQSQSNPPRLVLVRYHPETRSTSWHTLTVPDTIDLNDLNGLCIDDTVGAIHLVNREGLFSTLRYV